MFQQLRVAAGQHDVHGMTANFRRENVPVQLRGWRPVREEGERAVGDLGKRWRHFHFVVGLKMVLRVIDKFERISPGQWVEEHILTGDQDRPASRALECFGGADLRKHVAAAIRGRRALVLLSPVRRDRVGDSKILVAEDIVGHASAFGHGRDGITCARPGALYQDDSFRHLHPRLDGVGKVAAVFGRGLRLGALTPSQRGYRHREEN